MATKSRGAESHLLYPHCDATVREKKKPWPSLVGTPTRYQVGYLVWVPGPRCLLVLDLVVRLGTSHYSLAVYLTACVVQWVHRSWDNPDR
jgi:hypothetical protein